MYIHFRKCCSNSSFIKVHHHNFEKYAFIKAKRLSEKIEYYKNGDIIKL